MFYGDFMWKMCGFGRFYRNMCNPFWPVWNPFRSFSLSSKYVWRFLELAWAFMQLSTGCFRSDFVKICDFYTENAVQFSIRSDPFFEVFRNDLSSKVDMYAYWAITYAYTIVLVSILCQNLEFLSRNAIRFLSVLFRSIRNKTRSYALLCKIVPCMPI